MNQPENGFEAPPVEELVPLFPSYEILSLIAVGGMGAVYHAMQTSLEREVAIKILPVEFGEDKEFCESFGAEAKAMAKLNHPNLIGVYDFGEVNGMLFIVMEYVSGQSLHEASSGVPIDADEVIRMMTGVCQGLAHAHKQGILHRDIKPANILLDDQLQPKIGDFGLARPVDAQVQEGETIFGTPGYTAPEVVDSPNAVDQRADIFSLGVLLHELLTGGLPSSDPRPPSEIAFCDSRLDAVVHKATQPNPQHRYQNAAEIAKELEQIATTDEQPQQVAQTVTTVPLQTTTYRPPTPQQYSYQPAKKGGGGMVIAVLLAVGLVLVLIFRDQIFPKTEPEPDSPPVTDQNEEPVIQDPEVPQNEPLKPDPSLTNNDSTEPESNPSSSDPKTVQLAPNTVVPEHGDPKPDPVAPDPSVSDPEKKPEPVKAEPKFDVDAFLAHARSVMVKRCEPIMVKREKSLEDSVKYFRTEAWRSAQVELSEKWHEAARREIDAYSDKCNENGNRMLEELDKPLKPKKWLKALYEECKEKEAKADEDFRTAFSEHKGTYLYGLGLKVKALQKEGDAAAVDLIKAEVDKVNENDDYFQTLMLDAKKDS